MNRFLKYFSWTMILMFLLYIGLRIQINLKEIAHENFNLLPYTLFLAIFPIIIGIFLGISHLIKNVTDGSYWSINWAKLIGVGLPTLYITATPFMYYTPLGQYLPFTFEISRLGMTNTITNITGLIFGYILLDSLKKRKGSNKIHIDN